MNEPETIEPAASADAVTQAFARHLEVLKVKQPVGQLQIIGRAVTKGRVGIVTMQALILHLMGWEASWQCTGYQQYSVKGGQLVYYWLLRFVGDDLERQYYNIAEAVRQFQRPVEQTKITVPNPNYRPGQYGDKVGSISSDGGSRQSRTIDTRRL